MNEHDRSGAGTRNVRTWPDDAAEVETRGFWLLIVVGVGEDVVDGAFVVGVETPFLWDGR